MEPELVGAEALAIPWARVLGVLLLATMATGGAALLLRRLLGPTTARPRRILRLVDAVSLGQRRTVYALDVEGRTLVLAAAADRVTLLTELPAPAIGVRGAASGANAAIEAAAAVEPPGEERPAAPPRVRVLPGQPGATFARALEAARAAARRGGA